MRVFRHSPLLLTGARRDPKPASAERFFHGSLWVDVEVSRWKVRRSGHLHLVRRPDDPDWGLVDIGRHPMAAWKGEDAVDWPDLERSVRCFTEVWTLRVFRIEELGMVSELGEGREEFRRRALGLVRPTVQDLVESEGIDEASLEGRKRQLAGEIARLTASIESWESDDSGAAVKRAEIGTLWVADDVDLQPPRYRALML